MLIIMVLMEWRKQNYSDTPDTLHEFSMIKITIG